MGRNRVGCDTALWEISSVKDCWGHFPVAYCTTYWGLEFCSPSALAVSSHGKPEVDLGLPPKLGIPPTLGEVVRKG